MGDARETEKAPDAFRTISEVADDLDLPQHVLRFWETRFPQIKPVKRAGGRRFYRPEDVDLLRGIRHLLYTDGYTIKGAQRILKDQGVRFVQDLGIEREVAVMRTARMPRDAASEGVTFGGLLGLLPRRRPKGNGGRDDAALPDLPPMAELPLPFPDRDADRDLDVEAPVPPIALRPAASDRPRRPSAGERIEPPVERREPPRRETEERREPRMEARAPLEEEWRASADITRQDPSFEAAPARDPHRPSLGPAMAQPRRTQQRPAGEAERRIEPAFAPQRPTRGPAARIAAGDERRPHSPELDDPLLPFLDDDPQAPPSLSEPIEARIRRLKAQDRASRRAFEEDDWSHEPDAPHPGGREPEARQPDVRPEPPMRHAAARPDPGPPEEYIPARARRPAPPRAAVQPQEEDDFDDVRPAREAGADRSPRPRLREEDTRRRQMQDGDWRQADWVEEAGDNVRSGDTGRTAERAGRAAPGAAVHPASDLFADDRFAADRFTQNGPIEDRFGLDRAGPVDEDVFPENRSMDQDRRRPPAAPLPTGRRDAITPADARPMRRDAEPPAFRQDGRRDALDDGRTGAWNAAWSDAWGDAPPQTLPRATRVGPLIGPIDEEEPPHLLPRHPQPGPAPGINQRVDVEASSAPWSRPEPSMIGPAAARPGAPFASPEAPQGAEPARAPREPLRHGPPEQYLPPHLRSEPRVVGHAPVAAPVLSRDDVHRLQSVLYELGECRRLVEGVLVTRDEARDAG